MPVDSAWKALHFWFWLRDREMKRSAVKSRKPTSGARDRLAVSWSKVNLRLTACSDRLLFKKCEVELKKSYRMVYNNFKFIKYYES